MYASSGLPIKVRKLVKGYGGEFQGKRARTRWQEVLKGVSGEERVNWGRKWESRGEEGIQGKRTNTEYLLKTSYENDYYCRSAVIITVEAPI